MKWIHHYQLFLFDFDGILVNTEELHFKAYKKMCKARGFSLRWDLPTYISYAMYSAAGLKEGIYKEFPDLKRYEPCWEILYKEKKQAYIELISDEGAALMPGVEKLLIALSESNIKRCVVTHSTKHQIDVLRRKNPLLDSIPVWITREQYSEPKPNSECYEKAIAMLADPEDRIAGFEDSPRGLKALLGTKAEGFFITSLFDAKAVRSLESELGREFSHYDSFKELFKKVD